MDDLNKKQKIILSVILGIMVLVIGYYIIQKSKSPQNYTQIEEETFENKIEKDEKEIIIHITGAIKNEGIIKAKKGARISDVIELAGGTTEIADITKVNLAYKVEDGQKIYIPNIYDEEENQTILQDNSNIIIVNNETESDLLININIAGQAELETLSGIGPSTALKIIEYRKSNGNFKKIEDLKNVPGIGESKFENIKDNICTK